MYVAVFALTYGFTSCSVDVDAPAVDIFGITCAANATAVAEAANDYATDATPNSCELYKAAIQDYKDGGCGAEFDAALAALPESCLEAGQ